MRELESLLPTLQPPPGGLARLQRAIERQRKPRPRWSWVGAAVAAVLVLALWLPPYMSRWQQTDALAGALQQAMQAPTQDIHVAHGAAIELPSGQANVRLYLVQTR